MKSKIFLIIAGVVLALGAGTAAFLYFTKSDIKPISQIVQETTKDPHAGMQQSYLTGKYVKKNLANTRPYAVMINNIEDAIPQYGISNADVMYEAPVEGDITRMMAIFSNPNKIKRLGSVRSCRIYYAYIACEWDAMYAHYGQSKYAKKFLRSKKIDNICSWNAEYAFYRTQDKPAPHNCYTSDTGLKKAAKKLKYKITHKKNYKGTLKFVKDEKDYVPESGEDVKTVKIGYAINKPYYKYNKKDKKYYRYQYGKKHIDEVNKKQLAYDNILIQLVKNTIYSDNKSLNIKQTGKGKGYYITKGKYIKITWKKSKKLGITKYYNEDGKRLEVNTGRTIVNIVQTSHKKNIKFKNK